MSSVLKRYLRAAMALIIALVLVIGGFFLFLWLAWIWYLVPHSLAFVYFPLKLTPAIFALIIGMTVLVISVTIFIWNHLWAKQLKKQVSMETRFHRHSVKS